MMIYRSKECLVEASFVQYRREVKGGTNGETKPIAKKG